MNHDETKPDNATPAQNHPEAAHQDQVRENAPAPSSESFAAEGESEPSESNGTLTEESGSTLAQQLAAARQETADYLDALQRLKAEFDNFRKRLHRERLQQETFFRESIIAKFLPIRDNLERAVAAAAGQNSPDALVEGAKMIDQQFETVLAELGVKRIEALGQTFDPNLHNAMMTQAQEGVQPGLVLQVLTPGYALEDRILRPANVIVSS